MVEHRRISAWDQEERDLRNEEKIKKKKASVITTILGENIAKF